MLEAIKTAFTRLLSSRKVWLWLVACVGTGVMAIVDGTPQAADLFWQTFQQGAALVGTLFAVEDAAAKLNKPAEPAG